MTATAGYAERLFPGRHLTSATWNGTTAGQPSHLSPRVSAHELQSTAPVRSELPRPDYVGLLVPDAAKRRRRRRQLLLADPRDGRLPHGWPVPRHGHRD